ncbi:hypothetical protein [Pseudomonas syringae]|uniref:hypothetical protein n=1 Tax=Pseudomonas syringae TaxID=317 RepID=UPI00211A1723|nr:hypothetical protein [Pseudomonas syringae]
MKTTPVGTFVIGAESRSSGKGKSPLSDTQAKAEVMLSEYRHALNDGLGAAEGDAFELACLHYLGNHKNVGVAWMRAATTTTVQKRGSRLTLTRNMKSCNPKPRFVRGWVSRKTPHLHRKDTRNVV